MRSWHTDTDPTFVHASVRADGCDTPIDLLFILDGSTSMLYDFNAEMVFTRDVIRYFTIGPNRTRVAAITFSDEP